MSDFLITNAAGHFAASKNMEYQDRVRQRYRVFVDFLQNHSLTTRMLLPPEAVPDASLKIMRSDLTDIGYSVVHAAYDKWLKSHDRGTPIEDVTLFEKTLAIVTTGK